LPVLILTPDVMYEVRSLGQFLPGAIRPLAGINGRAGGNMTLDRRFS